MRFTFQHNFAKIVTVIMHSEDDMEKCSKRWRKKKLKKMSVEQTASAEDVSDNDDDETIEAEVRQEIDNVEVPVSLPDKAVCIQIHTGMSISN